MRTGFAGHVCADATPGGRASKAKAARKKRMQRILEGIGPMIVDRFGLLPAADVATHDLIVRVPRGDERDKMAGIEDFSARLRVRPLEDGLPQNVPVLLRDALVRHEQRMRDARG